MIPADAKELIKEAIMIRVRFREQFDDHDPQYWRYENIARTLEIKAKGLQRKAREAPTT